MTAPMTAPMPAPPALIPMTQVRCEVGALVTLGPAKYGERRYVPLGGGTVQGPELNGTLVEGGVTGKIGNWTIFGGVNWQQGGAYRSTMGGQIGVRYTFGKAAPAPAPVAPAPAKTCADLDDDGDGVNNCNDTCPNSTAGQAVGPDGCPVPLTIDLRGVHFDFDKDALRPDSIAILDEAVAILQRNPSLKVEVAGHTDECGADGYNQGLSDRRARAASMP